MTARESGIDLIPFDAESVLSAFIFINPLGKKPPVLSNIFSPLIYLNERVGEAEQGVAGRQKTGVTPGARSFAKDGAGHIVKGGKRHPNEEDNVTIYPNSTILGGETVIGANSTIGSNVFLLQSVPPNSLVVYEEKQLLIRDKNGKNKTEGLDWEI